jgi:hypothetical protein
VSPARAAAVLLESTPEKIVFAGNRAEAAGAPDRALGIPELASEIFRRAPTVPGIEDAQLESTRTYNPSSTTPPTSGHWSPYPSVPYSAHPAEVEVDRDTGIVTVRRYSGVHGCGTWSPRFGGGWRAARFPSGCGTGRNGDWPWTCSMRSPGRSRAAVGAWPPTRSSADAGYGDTPGCRLGLHERGLSLWSRSRRPPAPIRLRPKRWWRTTVDVGDHRHRVTQRAEHSRRSRRHRRSTCIAPRHLAPRLAT